MLTREDIDRFITQDGWREPDDYPEAMMDSPPVVDVMLADGTVEQAQCGKHIYCSDHPELWIHDWYAYGDWSWDTKNGRIQHQQAPMLWRPTEAYKEAERALSATKTP